IVAIGKREARAEILAARRVDNESPLRIVLLQGIARGEKMDWILQKATELGVARVLPVESERSEVQLDGAPAAQRPAHRPPTAAALREGLGFILDPFADASLASLQGGGLRASAIATCTLAIGPEGGWSPRDREQLVAAGFAGLRLGPRVLRTETAGIAAIAALQALCGDLA